MRGFFSATDQLTDEEKICFKIDAHNAEKYLIQSTGPGIYARIAGQNITENIIEEGEERAKWLAASYPVNKARLILCRLKFKTN